MTDQPVVAESSDLGKTSSGMQPNFAALLSYVFGVVTGLIFFLTEKENKFVRFHAMQSIVLSLGGAVVSFVLIFIPIIGWIMIPVWQIALIIAWIVCMVCAYQGKWLRLPVIGNIAAKQAGTIVQS